MESLELRSVPYSMDASGLNVCVRLVEETAEKCMSIGVREGGCRRSWCLFDVTIWKCYKLVDLASRINDRLGRCMEACLWGSYMRTPSFSERMQRRHRSTLGLGVRSSQTPGTTVENKCNAHQYMFRRGMTGSPVLNKRKRYLCRSSVTLLMFCHGRHPSMLYERKSCCCSRRVLVRHPGDDELQHANDE